MIHSSASGIAHGQAATYFPVECNSINEMPLESIAMEREAVILAVFISGSVVNQQHPVAIASLAP